MQLARPILNAFTAGELSPHLEGRTDHDKYYLGCRRLENFVVRPHGSVFRRPGTRFAAMARDQSAAPRLIPFDFNGDPDQAYVLEFTDQSMRVFHQGGLVMDGEESYLLATPWTGDQVADIRFVQSADTLFMAHPHVPPQRLTRQGHADWELAPLEFKMPGHDLDVTDGNADGAADGRHGDTVTLPMDFVFDTCCVVRADDGSGGTGIYRYQGSGAFAAEGETLILTFRDSPDHAENELESLRDSSGEVRTEFWKAMASDSSRPKDWEGDNQPALVCLYEDRLVLGAAPGQPLDLWFSRSGAYEDFRTDTAPFVDGIQDEPLAEDAFKLTLCGGQVSPVRWLLDGEDLLAGTGTGEIRIWSGVEGKALAPDRRQGKRQTSRGSAQAPALAAGGAALHLSRSRLRVLCSRFDMGSYRYASSDLTLLADHVTGPGLVDMDYAREPDGVLWAVRSDGELAACTWLPEENVVAWHRHMLGGEGRAEAVACIPGQGGDEVWLAVRRETGGQVRRFVERMVPQESTALEDAFFVDCGLGCQGPPLTRIQGLDHLEGETVAVLADGQAQPPRQVVDGGLDLDQPASTVQAGLAYSSLLQPMRLEASGGRGTSQGARKRIMAVTMRFLDTVGGRVCPGDDVPEKYEPALPVRVPGPSGMVPALSSGDMAVRLSGGFDRDGLFTLRQDDPLPMTVICLIPEAQFGAG